MDEKALITLALAIERADNEHVPEGFCPIDHDEISDWGWYLATKAAAAIRALPLDNEE